MIEIRRGTCFSDRDLTVPLLLLPLLLLLLPLLLPLLLSFLWFVVEVVMVCDRGFW